MTPHDCAVYGFDTTDELALAYDWADSGTIIQYLDVGLAPSWLMKVSHTLELVSLPFMHVVLNYTPAIPRPMTVFQVA